jgi:hypothetical protein
MGWGAQGVIAMARTFERIQQLRAELSGRFPQTHYEKRWQGVVHRDQWGGSWVETAQDWWVLVIGPWLPQ